MPNEHDTELPLSDMVRLAQTAAAGLSPFERSVTQHLEDPAWQEFYARADSADRDETPVAPVVVPLNN